MQKVFKSTKDFNTLYKDLQQSITDNKFGLLHTHDIEDKLTSKGLDFKEKFLTLNVCNPMIAKEVLDIDMSAGASLPCSIAIYTKDGETYVSAVKPTVLFPQFNEKLKELSQKMEKLLFNIIESAI